RERICRALSNVSRHVASARRLYSKNAFHALCAAFLHARRIECECSPVDALTSPPPLPRISIVTPSYNQAAFLEATLRSVLEQDYPRVEYLVVDGGSTDGSVEILRRYADRLAWWVSERDAGQSDAINRGLARARGEIVAYLNSDDLYRPGAISAAVRFLAAHPDVGIAYGACDYFEEDGTVSPMTPPEFDLRRLLLGNYIAQPATFLRRAALDRVGALDPSLRYCMDYDLWVRAATAGVALARVPGPPLAAFRIWGGAKTSKAAAAGLCERLAILERAFATPALAGAGAGFRAYARARAAMTAAYSELLNGDMAAARRVLVRALAASPRVAGDRQFLVLCGATLLGARLSRSLRRARARARGAPAPAATAP